MILAHPLLGSNVAEPMTLLLIVSSHAQLEVLQVSSLHNFRNFSAAC
jgi:hypothetical protein